MTRPIRFGHQPRLADGDDVVDVARRAEATGFDVFLLSDHVGGSLAPMPALGTAAVATATIRLGTFVLNFLFRVFLDFKGTDTHGLKAFRRTRLLEVVDRCKVDRDLFTSEFVIRAERMKFRIVEIPIDIAEKRPPSINLIKRVPNVLKNLGKLVWVIRIKDR